MPIAPSGAFGGLKLVRNKFECTRTGSVPSNDKGGLRMGVAIAAEFMLRSLEPVLRAPCRTGCRMAVGPCSARTRRVSYIPPTCHNAAMPPKPPPDEPRANSPPPTMAAPGARLLCIWAVHARNAMRRPLACTSTSSIFRIASRRLAGPFHFTSFRALIIGCAHDISVPFGAHFGSGTIPATYPPLGVRRRAEFRCARRTGELATQSHNPDRTS